MAHHGGKTASREISMRYFNQDGIKMAVKMAPRWPQGGPKRAPREPQEGSKTAQEGPKRAPRGSKRAPRCPKRARTWAKMGQDSGNSEEDARSIPLDDLQQRKYSKILRTSM